MSERSILDPSYVVSELRENATDTEWWRGRLQQRINSPIQGAVRDRGDALDILEEEWGTLVVLDACRADLFNSISETDDLGESHTVQSIASSTPEWLQRTFGESHGDIVYIAGNPMVTRHRPSSFHKLVESWKDGYDPEKCVIEPKPVTEAAIKARQQYPDKRLIVHYMQPHYPFIGHENLNYANYKFEDVGLRPNNNSHESIGSVWDALKRGIVDQKSVWEGYKDNLREVIPEVKRLVSEIDDDIIVTSDHGNSLGERSWPVPLQTFGHPDNLRLSSLVDIPIVRIHGDSRNTRDDGVNSVEQESEEIRDRLSDLGYLQ